MLGLRKIAVTGGLSSGKSTVCQMFGKLGAFVVSADEIVHRLLSPKTKIGKKIIDLLGPEILSDDQFDRAKIAKKVFSQKDTLHAFEQILHPAVIDEIETLYQHIKDQGKYRLFVAEIPLLYESENEQKFDIVIAVVSDPALCRERFQSKTKYPNEEFEKRMTRQWDMTRKASQADFTITNNGTLLDLNKNVTKLYQELIKGP